MSETQQGARRGAVTGMTSCVARVEKALGGAEGVAGVNVNFAAEKATVDYDVGRTRLEDLVKAVEEAGYGAGVRATVEGNGLLIGNARFISEMGVSEDGLTARAEELSAGGKTPMFVAVGGRPAGLLVVPTP